MYKDLIKAARDAVENRANNKGYRQYMSSLPIWQTSWKMAEAITDLTRKLADMTDERENGERIIKARIEILESYEPVTLLDRINTDGVLALLDGILAEWRVKKEDTDHA